MVGASSLTTLGALPPFLVGALAVFIREEIGIGLGMLGLAISVFFGAAAVGSILAGLVFDRVSSRVPRVAAGLLVCGGGTLMAAVVDGAVWLVVAMALLGLGNACCQTIANVSMARVLPPHRRGLGFGVKQSAVPLAIMLGGLAVPTLGQTLGWRSSFVITAAFGFLVIATGLIGGRTGAATPAPTPVTPEVDAPPWLPLALAGLAIVFASASANFLGSFIASWGNETGLSPSAAGLLMAAGSGASIAVRVYSGYRADQRAGRNLPVVAWQMFAGAVCLAGLAIELPATVVVFGFMAFGVGWAWPGLLLFAVARIGRDVPARASGVIQAGAFVGGAIGPVGFGALVTVVGFQVTWLAAAASFVLAGTLVLLARRGFSHDMRARPPREELEVGGRRYPRPPRHRSRDSRRHRGPGRDQSRGRGCDGGRRSGRGRST